VLNLLNSLLIFELLRGMYVVPPPQRSDLGSGSDGLRVYQAWKGSNVSSHCGFCFFFNHLFHPFTFISFLLNLLLAYAS
jgi:hypothetical protein